jgi:hypothetical protein
VWYDNEYGYSRQVLRFAKYLSNVIRLTYYWYGGVSHAEFRKEKEPKGLLFFLRVFGFFYKLGF